MSSRTEGPDRRFTATRGALIAAVAAALMLRLPGLGSGLWLDEISALLVSFRPAFARLTTNYAGDIQHPLYALLAHASLSLFGESPWSVRLPALAFGVATVPLLHALARRFVDTREALAAAILLAVSYHHVWFSQNARGYTAVAFWTVLATYLLLGALERDDLRWFVGYGVVLALAAYTHLTMALLAAAQLLVAGGALLLARRTERRTATDRRLPRLALGFALAAVLGLLLYAPMLPSVLEFFLHRRSTLAGVSTPGWAFVELVRRLGIGLGSWIGLALAAPLAVAGLASWWRRTPQLVLLFTAPAALTVAATVTVRGTLYPRYLFFLAGFGVLVLVRGAWSLSDVAARRIGRPRWAQAFALAIVTVLAAGSLGALAYRHGTPKQDFGGPLAALDARLAAGDSVATVDVTSLVYQPYFGRAWTALESAEQLTALRRRAADVWLVYTFPRYLASRQPEIAKQVDDGICQPIDVYPGTVGDGAIRVCRFPPLPTETAP